MRKRYDKRQDTPKWHYYAFPEKSYHIDLGHYNTYGIQLAGSNNDEILHDVSVCEETVSRITELLNSHQVFPCHFKDVTEDLLHL